MKKVDTQKLKKLNFSAARRNTESYTCFWGCLAKCGCGCGMTQNRLREIGLEKKMYPAQKHIYVNLSIKYRHNNMFKKSIV